jgi:hypothetical protein
MTSEQTLYRDQSPWPGWVDVLLGSITVVLCFSLLAGWGTSLPFGKRLIGAGLIGGSLGALKVFFGGLTVLVRDADVVLHLGRFPIVRRTVPYAEIESLRAVRYHPIREFGGWGIRGMGKRKAWTARGDRAVALRLIGGRELLVGSDYPQRLAERIRAASGRSMSEE